MNRFWRAVLTLGRASPRFRMTGAAATDVGKLRRHNEDCFVFQHLGRHADGFAGDDTVRSMPATGAILLVADGMGGPAAGEVASGMAARTVAGRLSELWRSDRTPTAEHVTEALRVAMAMANGEIHRYASRDPDLKGMGTTATAAVLVGDRVSIAHVGDSRTYVVRGGRAQRLTQDHSWTQHLVDIGAVSAEEAARHPQGNILLRALGPRPEVAVDVAEHRLQDGDVLVLCSDGLWSAVADDELAGIVTARANPAVAAGTLVDLANGRGGRDNVTVLVAHVGLDRPDAGGEPVPVPAVVPSQR